jgi:hypothetical protein
MLTIWLAVYALTMLAALAGAACSAAVANSAGFGRWSPSLTSKSVRDSRHHAETLMSQTAQADHGYATSAIRTRTHYVFLRKGRDSRPRPGRGSNAGICQ